MYQLSPCCVSIFSPLRETSKNRTPPAATSDLRVFRSKRCTTTCAGCPGTGNGSSSPPGTPPLPASSPPHPQIRGAPSPPTPTAPPLPPPPIAHASLYP